METLKKIIISATYMLSLGLTLIPSLGLAGGEQSGGGGLPSHPIAFESMGDARRAFAELDPTEAYLSKGFDRSIPNVYMPGTSTYFKANTSLCLSGDFLETVYPSSKTGKIIKVPIHEMSCSKWKVDRKEHHTPRTFSSKASAERYADESRKARGEPYCDEEDWELKPVASRISYRVQFYARVQGKERMSSSTEVGFYRYQFFPCSNFVRERAQYSDYVSMNEPHPADWVQMAGGEQSGGGGKPRRAN